MKKLLFLLLVASSIANSQNVTKKETITQLLCKTWVADHALLGGLKVSQMGEMKSLKYTFKADGTYQVNDKSGKWKFNEKKKCIELFLNEALKSTITSLDNKKYIMVLNTDKKTEPKGSPKFEIYFKPKS